MHCCVVATRKKFDRNTHSFRALTNERSPEADVVSKKSSTRKDFFWIYLSFLSVEWRISATDELSKGQSITDTQQKMCAQMMNHGFRISSIVVFSLFFFGSEKKNINFEMHLTQIYLCHRGKYRIQCTHFLSWLCTLRSIFFLLLSDLCVFPLLHQFDCNFHAFVMSIISFISI